MKRMGIRKLAGMFLAYTADSVKGYVMGLFPRTEVHFLTNRECRKVINISRVWMGEAVGRNDVYELKEIDAERIRLEKEHLPRMAMSFS